MRWPLWLLLLVCAVGGATAHAQSPPAVAPAPAATMPSAPTLSPAQAQQVLDVLQDDRKRAAFLATLQDIAKALPPPAATPAVPVASAAPASPAAPATPAASAGSSVLPLAPNSLGAVLLLGLSHRLTVASSEFVQTARTVTDFPLLGIWLRHLAQNPQAQRRLLDAGWKLGLVLLFGAAVERLAVRALRRSRRSLDGMRLDCRTGRRVRIAQLEESVPVESVPMESVPVDAPANSTDGLFVPPRRRRPSPAALMRRVPFVLLRLVIDLVPVGAFAAVGYGLLATPLGGEETTRLVILAVMNAYLTCRILMCATRMMVSPNSPPLRLVHVSDETAAYITVWVRRLAIISIFGYALTEVGLLFGLYPAVHDALLKLVALVAHTCLVIIVLQIRRPVADWLRAGAEARGPYAVLRNRAAEIWHYVAIFYIVALWLVWAFEVENGFARLWHVFLSTVIVVTLARLAAIVALGALDRSFRIGPDLAARFPGLEARADRYHPLLRGVVSVVIGAFALVALLQAWGLGALLWFRSGQLGGRLVSALLTIAVACAVAVAVWEASNAALERRLARLTSGVQIARAARLRTLLPILRTALFIAILTVVGLTALSEIGVNIGPLLAGAGIVGVAIGFGSQKLVQDFITGIFLLFENAMQVGDWVTVSGLSGSVEHLSIRTIRLRAGDGSVHIIPFSAVTSVTNTNRGIGNAAVSVTVAYEEDTDRIGGLLTSIVAEMRTDPAFAGVISSDLQLWGVDKVDAATVTIVGQIVCTDTGRWGVQREFNRRMKKRFQELGITVAGPMQRVLVQQPHAAPAVRPSDPGSDSVSDPGSDPGPGSVPVTQSPAPAALGNRE
ncbi:MAG: mechanosensitive ion channel [Acidisphaera sp.]|nr:mechanosensitive ion channel [Acidisphaera sp.]